MSDTTQLSLSKFALKITAALYRVTDLLDEEEPLRKTLRRQGMHILDLVSGLESAHEAHAKLEALEKVLSTMTSITNVLSVAQEGGYVSQINFSVLQNEYYRLQKYIDDIRLPLMTTRTGVESISISDNIIKDIKDKSKLLRTFKSSSVPSTEHSYELSTEERKSMRTPSSSINERQNRLQGLLKDKGGWLSVSEIAAFYGEGVSTKTIQRDLNELLSAGLIVAEGERRWRRYTAPQAV
jgi:hypothetical protein